MRPKRTLEKFAAAFYGKKAAYCLFAAALALLIMSVQPGLADYVEDGCPEPDSLKSVDSGTVKGGVYVDGGHGLDATPYTQTFNVPGNSTKFARLYVGVWGGNARNTGTLDVTFNDFEFETLDLKGEEDDNPEVYCSGNGVYWVTYNVTEIASPGSAEAVVKTGGSIDGKVYGVVLVAVYEDEDGDDVKYWIKEGNVNLHGESSDGKGDTNDELTVSFSGTVNPDKYELASLSVVYLTGTSGEEDYLYFNDEQLSDGTNKNDIANSKDYFDFKVFDVLDYLEKSGNEMRVERGEEEYLHPVLAVLSLSTGEEGDMDLKVSDLVVPLLYAGEENIIKASIENIGDDPASSFQVALYVDDRIVSTALISSLRNGGKKTVEFNWEADCDGEHFLKVFADSTDRRKELCEINNNNTPLKVNIIDLTPPEIEIEQPEDGESVNSGLILVSGTVEDTSEDISVTVNGEPALLSEGKWRTEVELPAGFNRIFVSAVDGAGNMAGEFLFVDVPGSKEISPKRDLLENGERNAIVQGTSRAIPEKSETESLPFPPFAGGAGILLAAFVQLRRRWGK
ncbi:DUF3344 domain-containing protein [Methanosarcina sp. KYL-1]|uniref:DUF3344 domain-containing protein n=1 Tax=Methanosarcina sp. KYL-1 TaxID=2602068 RepID=UPI002100A9FC|nr:DUF3344 domain-containing protein [Methanosarcina sp. KYL-1]